MDWSPPTNTPCATDAVHEEIALLANEFCTQQIEAMARMPAYRVHHPRGKRGGIDYELAPLGLDKDDLRARTGFYMERFRVSTEPRLA